MRDITPIKFCYWCGDPFVLSSPNQKYCPPGIKNCSKEAKRESWRKASNKYRMKYKDVIFISQVYKLGTGWLSSNANPNFEEEYVSVQKEKKRLKINTFLAGIGFWVQFTNRGFLDYFLNRDHMFISEIYPLLIALTVFFVAIVIFGTYYE